MIICFFFKTQVDIFFWGQTPSILFYLMHKEIKLSAKHQHSWTFPKKIRSNPHTINRLWKREGLKQGFDIAAAIWFFLGIFYNLIPLFYLFLADFYFYKFLLKRFEKQYLSSILSNTFLKGSMQWNFQIQMVNPHNNIQYTINTFNLQYMYQYLVH